MTTGPASLTLRGVVNMTTNRLSGLVAFTLVSALSGGALAQAANDPPATPPPALPAPDPTVPVTAAPNQTTAPIPAPATTDEPLAPADPQAAEGVAVAEDHPGRDRVVAYYTGLQIGIAPGFILPTKGGDIGFLLSLYGGYGVQAGSVVVIPGAHATGAWPPGVFIGTFTPSVKVVFPIGAFAPYIEGGAGPGYVSLDKQVGVALRVGAGFSVHPTSRFAIGAGAYYETIAGTDVSFLGPVLILSF